ncbi:MAG TPA: ATP-binding protein [Kofleriaceae bacterium]|nr:ATP-binding protein [Kofleriaceae bacterium]
MRDTAVNGCRCAAVHRARPSGPQTTLTRRAASHSSTLARGSPRDNVQAVLEFVIEAMVDAVLGVDPEGRVTLSNSGAANLTGYTRDELAGKPISELLVDDSSGLRTVVRRRIEDGDILRREESWLVAKSGKKIPVSVTGSPVLDAEGMLKGIVLVARDVREVRELLVEKEAEIVRRREAEEALRTAKASIEEKLEQTRTQLLLAERRATLGTLAGGVGHELRNIAQIQIAAIDELQTALAANEDIGLLMQQVLPDLERVGEHITAHGHRLMQLARPGPDHVAPIELDTVVRDIAAMLKQAGKLGRVECVLDLGGEPLSVTVNRTRIEQILVNLVINAVDAMPGEGTVTVSVRPSADGKRVVCAVRDTGTGMPPDVLDKIFEAFFTTKGERGTGLGLPVVRDIVETYGGALVVETVPGEGSTFTFDLPR